MSIDVREWKLNCLFDNLAAYFFLLPILLNDTYSKDHNDNNVDDSHEGDTNE